jgi:hypothetical protein
MTIFHPHIGLARASPTLSPNKTMLEYDDQKKGYYKNSKVDKAEASIHFLSWTS